MGMTIDEAISIITSKGNYSYTVIENKAKDVLIDTARKYQMLQLDYEARLKADMVAMFTELKTEVDAMSDSVVEGRTVTITSWKGMQKRICKLIQSKIDKLREE